MSSLPDNSRAATDVNRALRHARTSSTGCRFHAVDGMIAAAPYNRAAETVSHDSCLERTRGLARTALMRLLPRWSNSLWQFSRGGRTDMSWSSKSVDFITLFVEDLERSKAFYHDVFGLQLVFEDENSAVFRFANTGINLLRTEAAEELIKPWHRGQPGRGRTIRVHHRRGGCRRGVRGTGRAWSGSAQRPGEPAMGSPHGELYRSRRPHLGDRRGPVPRRRFLARRLMTQPRPSDVWDRRRRAPARTGRPGRPGHSRGEGNPRMRLVLAVYPVPA